MTAARPSLSAVSDRTLRAALVAAAILVAASVALAIAADPGVAAERLRPAGLVADRLLGALRAAGTVRLVGGGLIAAVCYAVAMVAIGHVRRVRVAPAAVKAPEPTRRAPSRTDARTTARQLLAAGHSRAEIARRTGLSQDALALVLGAAPKTVQPVAKLAAQPVAKPAAKPFNPYAWVAAYA